MVINMVLDDEEEFNKLCSPCKVKSKESKCPGCGQNSIQEENPNFDMKRFEKLKNSSGGGS